MSTNEGCNSCASLAGLFSSFVVAVIVSSFIVSFIASFIVVVIRPLAECSSDARCPSHVTCPCATTVPLPSTTVDNQLL